MDNKTQHLPRQSVEKKIVICRINGCFRSHKYFSSSQFLRLQRHTLQNSSRSTVRSVCNQHAQNVRECHHLPFHIPVLNGFVHAYCAPTTQPIFPTSCMVITLLHKLPIQLHPYVFHCAHFVLFSSSNKYSLSLLLFYPGLFVRASTVRLPTLQLP